MNLKELIDNPNIDKSTLLKKETIKSVIVVNLLTKYQSTKRLINIYNNIEVGGVICDLFFENLENKKITIFKLTSNRTEESREKLKQKIDKEYFILKSEVHVLAVEEFSFNILEINEKIKRLI